ncbi:MAG: peptidylprolyl isomerase [Lachnospiraceae bacterium]|nr:peptidylprolyl isomerase [Lachnospiraceae bacterium]
MRNRCYCICEALFILSVLFAAGCGEGAQLSDKTTRIVLTTGFAKDEVFRIEKSSCMLPEIMVYLTNTKNQYEHTFGEEIWDASYDGETLEESIKETVLAKAARVKALNLLAAEHEIELDEPEQELAAQAAQEYYSSLNGQEKALMSADEELIRQMYEEYALSEKVYDYLIADINPEISDDEARTITVQHILIKTYSLDENGERVEYTQETKAEAYNKAVEALKRAQAGDDFTSLIAEYSEDDNSTYSFIKGTMDPDFEEAAFNLGTDEISGIVETTYGYHIIKCISTFDRDETDRNKTAIVEQRRREVFNEEYSSFVTGLAKNLNQKLWEQVGFIDDDEVTTDSFFEVYDKYFNNDL